MMLQQPEPDDYVIATGETHTIREFLDTAFQIAGYDSWEPYVTHDTRFDRPAEVDLLMGDATKAKEKLGGPRPSPSTSSSAGCTSRISRPSSPSSSRAAR